MAKLFVFCAIALSSLANAMAGPLQQLPKDMERIFEYDPALGLDIKAAKLYDCDGCEVYDLTYASPYGGRVPAYLVVPRGKGPFAGIVFRHWGNGNRTEFLPEAELYTRARAISILPAYPWSRPAPWYGLPLARALPDTNRGVSANSPATRRGELLALLT